MSKLHKIFQVFLPLILISLGVYLAFKNYTPNTFLLGWDSLHPEFNFQEAFTRAFFGVWRGEQGLGAVAIHSHMADIPRIIFLFLESFFIPLSFLRYSYIFLCLILGPLGVYFFLRYVFRREKEGIETQLGAFVGALFYLLNLTTLQNFLVPFEMFTTQYAFIPWLIFFALKVLREGKKKNFLIFSFLTLLSSPQAYAATLFYSYFGYLGLFILVYTIVSRNKKIFQRGLILVFLTLLLNLYWLLPNIYSVITQSSVVINAKINLLFSPEATLRNLSYSGLKDILIGKSFLFDWRVFNFEKSQFENLMKVWNLYLQNKTVNLLLYIFAGISILGSFLSILKRDRVGLSMFLVSLYCLFFLSGNNLNSKVVEEALRMPFTKFSVLFVLGMAFFFGYLFFKFIGIIRQRFVKVSVGVILTLIVFGGLAFSVWPMFTGNLISPIVKRSLPNEYFELFDWFKGKSGRIATLPLSYLWGWDYHSWKYEGSGFLTYGLTQPLLIRDFDRWSPYNESFYNEASFALYANDNLLFENILRKYKVKYLLLDESIINAGGSEDVLYKESIKRLLSTSRNINKSISFGFVTVYETNFKDIEKPVSSLNIFAPVNSNLVYSQLDPLYVGLGDYVQDSLGVPYPFANFDPRGSIDIGISPTDLIFSNKDMNLKVTQPIQNQIIETFVSGRGLDTGYNCDLEKLGNVIKEKQSDKVFYKANNGGVECDFYNYPDLVHSQAYILRVKGKNSLGRSLKIYLHNSVTNKTDLEELMPRGDFDKFFVVLPKKEITGKEKGYILDLETRSFGKIASENQVEKIEFYPFDLNSLISKRVEPTLITSNLAIKNIHVYGPWAYKIDVQGDGLIQLSQDYDDGWIAFPTFNFKSSLLDHNLNLTLPDFKKELKHVKVNSWSNGWVVPGDNQLIGKISTIYIFFWPQILEWGGMILAFFTLLLVVFKRR